MDHELTPTVDDQELAPETEGEPSRALIVHPVLGRLPGRVGLPALITERLPALWDGGRGPLAQAAIAGGLLALGSVVGRLAAGESRALVPSSPPAAPALARGGRRIVTIETEVGEATNAWGSRPRVQWVRQRVQIIQE
jgi:hypothetical protein